MKLLNGIKNQSGYKQVKIMRSGYGQYDTGR
jgi:hypothetical protein